MFGHGAGQRDVSVAMGFFAEMIGTLILALVIFSLTDKVSSTRDLIDYDFNCSV